MFAIQLEAVIAFLKEAFALYLFSKAYQPQYALVMHYGIMMLWLWNIDTDPGNLSMLLVFKGIRLFRLPVLQILPANNLSIYNNKFQQILGETVLWSIIMIMPNRLMKHSVLALCERKWCNCMHYEVPYRLKGSWIAHSPIIHCSVTRTCVV